MFRELETAHARIVASSTGTGYTPPSRAFEFAVDWDLDSTPDLVRRLSRALGTRTPELEASIALASLGHDIRYFYAGSQSMRQEADLLFKEEINEFAALLHSGGAKADLVSSADWLAVNLFGGWPFKMPYSWGYGLPEDQRGYTSPTHRTQLEIADFVTAARKLFGRGAYQLQQPQLSRIPTQAQMLLRRLRPHLLRPAASGLPSCRSTRGR